MVKEEHPSVDLLLKPIKTLSRLSDSFQAFPISLLRMMILTAAAQWALFQEANSSSTTRRTLYVVQMRLQIIMAMVSWTSAAKTKQSPQLPRKQAKNRESLLPVLIRWHIRMMLFAVAALNISCQSKGLLLNLTMLVPRQANSHHWAATVQGSMAKKYCLLVLNTEKTLQLSKTVKAKYPHILKSFLKIPHPWS
mmetsp:Transcript_114883/g.331989  ORF Transcript_114883/g.331989 Transcript_114883/m.331989 type:complete len:194 (-) Transcript_114883:618-1199(-)